MEDEGKSQDREGTLGVGGSVDLNDGPDRYRWQRRITSCRSRWGMGRDERESPARKTGRQWSRTT